MDKKVFSNRIKRANRSAGRAICMPKSMVLLAMFVVFGALIIPSTSSISAPSSKITYSYNVVNQDPNYYFENQEISYSSGKLIIQFDMKTNFSGHVPSSAKVGMSAGVSLNGISRLYTYNNGWIDRTGSISYLASKNIGGKTYDNLYYYNLGIMNDLAYKKVKIEITATKAQMRQWINSNNNLIIYFGEATSVLKITTGSTHAIAGGVYSVQLTNNSASLPLVESIAERVDWSTSEEWSSLWHTPGTTREVGRAISDCLFGQTEFTDLKIIIEETGCGPGDYERTFSFLLNYFMQNDTTPTIDSSVGYEYPFSTEFSAFINTSGVQSGTGLRVIPGVSQEWMAHLNNDNGEVACFVWFNDTYANDTNVLRISDTSVSFGSAGGAAAPAADWNDFSIRSFFYQNTSSSYWVECQDFWDRMQDSMTFTETNGTSWEIDKGLEYGIVADANNEIDVVISQGNTNQTTVLLTLDFVGNVSNISIFNSTTTINRTADELNNFSIIEAGGNFSYAETATADTEPANISACIVSNITGTTRCYVYLPFAPAPNSDIYLIAEPLGRGPGTALLNVNFITPTLSDKSYTKNNYIEVNASVSENVTSCNLEWDDGSATNESMTISNADADTVCFLNMTGLSDGDYLFVVYGELITIGLSATGQRNVTVDTTDPVVTITEPFSIEKSTQFYINYSASDTNLASCWHSIDSGTNVTIASCANTTVNVSTSGIHSVEVYANDSVGNIGGATKSFAVALFNLNVYNATDNATMTDWHVYFLNGSADSNSQFINNNTLTLNISDIPTGPDVEMTIWKNNSAGNATFNLSIGGTINVVYERHIIEDTFFVNFIAPANNSIYFFGQTFTMNISIPDYAEGNASIWYAFNGTLPYILGCSECTEFSRDVAFGGGDNVILALINNSQHYLGANNENKSHNITVFNPQYNITFFDEITNKSIDFSANKNGTIEFFCSDRTITQTVTGTLNDFILNCTGNLNIIKFKLFDPKGNHYRELIPVSRTGNLTLYMINTTPADTIKNLVTFLVTDASFTYQNGIMHFRKIILADGQKDIIDTRIGSDGKVYAYLIGGEKYTISVESSDGLSSKTLGEYTVPDTTATSQPLTIIDVTFIPESYNYIGTDISWAFDMDTTAGRIYAFYNDSSGETDRIQFWIYNITNASARTQMYYDSVSGQSSHLFQWDYVTNGNENDTYLGYLEITHSIHGNLTESRPIAKDTISRPWLGDIGKEWYHMISIFLLVFVAAIFGAKHAPIGAVILSIMAALFFYIEWLPAVIGGSARLSSLLMLSLLALSIIAMFIIKRRRV